MNFIPRPYQRECIDTITEQPPGAYLVQMATGLGKCLAKGTKVILHDGTVKAVEDVQVGDLLMGPDSRPRKVESLAHGWEEMYTITPTKGEPYTVNKSHILSLRVTGLGQKTLVGPHGEHYHTGDLCNISVADYLKGTKTFRHCVKGWRSGVDFPEKVLPVPPYIFGIWLGDGTAQKPVVTTMEPEVVRALHQYTTANDMQLVVADSRNTGKALSYSMIGNSRIHGCNHFLNFLKEQKLAGNKHIPYQYLCSSRKQRLELLAGVIDSDGYLVDGCCLELTTVSDKLAEDYLFLIRSLGLAAYRSDKYVSDTLYHRISISGNTDCIPVHVPRRVARRREQKKNALVTGIAVEPKGVGEYFGFTLSGPDRLFLLGDFTVTHNTAVFTHIPHEGRMLILSHREELVRQPLKWFDCSTGIEQGRNRSDHTEEVVSACTASLVHRLDGYDPEEFNLIIVDECHHAGAKSYKKILNHFKPEKLIGFTATPNRADKVKLNDVFQRIIFQRDLRWAIENKWLCPIHCLRVEIGYDLSGVHIRNGDYAPGELEQAMDGTADAIAEAYQDYAKGATLIFAVSVAQCVEIAKKIPGAVAVTGETKDRASIIEAFTRREIPCIVNCMVFTEGTDMPLVETVIVARPTTSEALYTQMVGRGLRLHPEKDKLTLIDCVGVAGRLSLCTAPSLLGVDLENVPANKRDQLEGDLFELPDKAAMLSDCPQSWVKNVQVVDLWARSGGYNTHDLNLFQCPDGRMQISLLENTTLTIPAPDALGMVPLKRGGTIPMQEAIDVLYHNLESFYPEQRYLWDLAQVRRWGKAPATDKQKALIAKRCPGVDVEPLNKMEASMILNGLKAHNWRWRG